MCIDINYPCVPKSISLPFCAATRKSGADFILLEKKVLDFALELIEYE